MASKVLDKLLSIFRGLRAVLTGNYSYKGLPSESAHIRRLILQPGVSDDPLVGTLEVVSLNDAAHVYPFEAISYVWRSEKKDRTITIDGKTLAIPKRLHDALRQTRLKDHRRALWADAICIRQDDPEEKGRQVSLMGRIFKTSKCTLICLGSEPECENDARDVKELIGDVEEMIKDVARQSSDWDSFPYPQGTSSAAFLSDPRWSSWVKLVEQSWFERGWVVQEAALAPNAIIFWAGMEVEWMSFLRVHVWLENRAGEFITGPARAGKKIIPEYHWQKYTLRQHDEAKLFFREPQSGEFEPITTLEMLDHARVSDLTDHKDRIYAFMSFPTSDEVMAKVKMQPDYATSTSHLAVYRDFATRYLEEMKDLDLLSLVEYAVVESGEDANDCEAALSANCSVPSWVPRWHCGGFVQGFFNPTNRKINANSQTIDMDKENGTLGVQAIIIDEVKVVSNRLQDCGEPEENLQRVVSLWREVADIIMKPKGSPVPLEDRLQMCFDFLDTICYGKHWGDLTRWGDDVRELASRLVFEQPIGTDPNDHKISALAIERSRNRCFVLLSGGYCGIAPHLTLEGDVCAIISGTRYPFILRKVVDDRYKVVGVAYVPSKTRDESGFSCRLGQYDYCEDWTSEDRDLRIQKIVLC